VMDDFALVFNACVPGKMLLVCIRDHKAAYACGVSTACRVRVLLCMCTCLDRCYHVLDRSQGFPLTWTYNDSSRVKRCDRLLPFSNIMCIVRANDRLEGVLSLGSKRALSKMLEVRGAEAVVCSSFSRGGYFWVPSRDP
jgi:hypothetical protein